MTEKSVFVPYAIAIVTIIIDEIIMRKKKN